MATSRSDGTAVNVLDALRAQNIALQVQLSSTERELAQCRHALDLAVTKAGQWGAMQPRVHLVKSLNTTPERSWPAADAALDRGADAALAALEAQVVMLSGQLTAERENSSALQQAADAARRDADATAAELEKVRGSAHEGAAGGKQPSAAVVAHLMAQIHFLHDEVERLEGAANEARDRSAQEVQAATAHLAKEAIARERHIDELNSETKRLRTQIRLGPKSARFTAADGTEVDAAVRVAQLETQLAKAIEEKNQTAMEKYDVQAKVRKLESAVRGNRTDLRELQDALTKEHDEAELKVKSLREAVKQLATDRDHLQKVVERNREELAPRELFSMEVQCEDTPVAQRYVQTDGETPSTVSAVCQVDTITPFVDAACGNVSVPALAQALEAKCCELDASRAAADELERKLESASSSLGQLRDAYESESNRRSALDEECERLSVQLRALQQQSSQLQVALRDKDSIVMQCERRMQEAINAQVKCEEERHVWEQQLAENARDMDQLVAQQSVANQQVAAASAENDNLRDELQKALQHTAQMKYALKAKETELAEVIAAYQHCVQEAEGSAQNVGVIERECDNLRALLSAKEERVNTLSEQVEGLHAREVQLSQDLQACDYQGSLLHRKLLGSEQRVAQLESQINELTQTLNASQRVSSEFERSQAELHKQLVLKENELMLMRQRCDNMEREHTQMMSSVQLDRQRMQDLEDTNARLVVRDLMTHVSTESTDADNRASSARQAEELSAARREASDLRKRLADASAALDTNRATLNDEQSAVEVLRNKVAELSAERDALLAAQSRLEQLVRLQASTLAQGGPQ